MFIAIRELKVARGRFVLVGLVVALVAFLGVLLSGLATGLVDDGISGLRAQRLTHLLVQEKSAGTFSKSTLTPLPADALKLNGVDSSELGMSFFNSKASTGDNVDLAVFGVAADSFLIPRADGRAALEKPGTIVISEEIAQDGIKVGDTLTLLGNEMTLTVAGVTQAGSYGHVPIAYTSLETWQTALYGSDPRDRFSAYALRMSDSSTTEVASVAKSAGMDLLSKEEAFNGSPGYEAETSTMTLIRGFLFVISILIVGAFFTVWTVQRTHEIGIMKALGASNGYVVRDALGQLAILLFVATLIGTIVGYGVGLAVPGAVPFKLEPLAVLAASLALIVTGLAGSLITVKRILSVDPIIALGAGS